MWSSRPVSAQMRSRQLVAVLVAAGLAVLVGGCTGGGSVDMGEGRPMNDTTPATQPPATDTAARAVVVDLVAEATGIADRLFQDPTVVNDPHNDDLARLREVYVDGSPTPAGIVARLHAMADTGQRERAAASGIFREVAIYQWEPPPDADTLRFETCSMVDTETVDSSGRVVRVYAQLILTGAEARRVDGVWRFGGFSDEASQRLEIVPGTAQPGYCRGVAPAPHGGGAP